MASARRRAIGLLREEPARELEARQAASGTDVDAAIEGDAVGDATLRLVLISCRAVHSCVARTAPVGCLTTGETARAFPGPEPTVTQRIVGPGQAHPRRGPRPLPTPAEGPSRRTSGAGARGHPPRVRRGLRGDRPRSRQSGARDKWNATRVNARLAIDCAACRNGACCGMYGGWRCTPPPAPPGACAGRVVEPRIRLAGALDAGEHRSIDQRSQRKGRPPCRHL